MPQVVGWVESWLFGCSCCSFWPDTDSSLVHDLRLVSGVVSLLFMPKRDKK